LIPLVKSFSFFYSVVICIYKYGINSISLLSAIVLDLKPKVIVTFVDNNTFMGELQDLFPDKLVISVQNGMRRESDPTFDNFCKFPNYFGFGEHMLHTLQDKRCCIDKYYSVGSLKLGVFLSEFYEKKIEKEQCLVVCLISQYVLDFDQSHNVKHVKYIDSLRRMCRVLADFSNNNVTIHVAMRSELNSKCYKHERTFFKEFFHNCNVVYFANKYNTMLSYQIGMDADIIVGLHSTLLYELFGVGKRVILFGQVDQELVDMLGCRSRFDFMPKECLLDSWSSDEFGNKMKLLIEMSDDYFLNKTKDERRYYMNFGDEYPHKVISNIMKNGVKFQ